MRYGATERGMGAAEISAKLHRQRNDGRMARGEKFQKKKNTRFESSIASSVDKGP